jgi:hypothetical protein
MPNKKKKYLFLVLAILVVIAAMGYYMYNKPAVNVRDADATKVVAGDLYRHLSRIRQWLKRSTPTRS